MRTFFLSLLIIPSLALASGGSSLGGGGVTWGVVPYGNTGAAATFSLTNNTVYTATVNQNTTVSFSNPTVGGTYVLKLTQGAGGPFTIAFTDPVTWPNSTIPTWSSATRVDVVTLTYDGTRYYATAVLNFILPSDSYSNAKSFSFASGKKVDFGNNFTNELSATWAISFWVKPNAANTSYEPGLISKNASGSYNGWLIYYNSATKAFQYYAQNGTGQTSSVVSGANALTVGVWQHVVLASPGTGPAGLKLYVNGVSVALTANPGALGGTLANAGPFRIGDSFSGNSLVGSIDEVTMWDADLSAAQLSALYNGGHPTDVAVVPSYAANCLSWWRMGDLTDSSTAAGGIVDRKGSVNGTGASTDGTELVSNVP